MASFLGIGVGILLGRKGWRLPFSPFTSLLFTVVAIVFSAQLNVQIQSQDELFFGLAESTAADVNFLVLPLVVALVAALMAALALPLGPLLRSMPPATRLRHRHRRLDGRHPRLHGALRGGHEPGRLVHRRGRPGRCSSPWAAGITAWSLVGGVAMLGVIYAVAVQAGSGEIWSPYYRIYAYPQRTASCTSTSTASRTRRSTRSTAPRSRSTTSSTSGSRAGPTTTCSSSEPAVARTWRSRSIAAPSTSTPSRSIRPSSRSA